MRSIVVFLCVTAVVVCCGASLSAWQERRFPDDFLFGTATAAYQIEGGWNVDDKSPSIWDNMTHSMPYMIKDASNGDIAADSFHNYLRDVEMMRELGVNAYRFSISWPRLIPGGLGTPSATGMQYYNNLINELLTYNITPVVTLYHWDLPQRLQNLGGFANPLLADWFEDYARTAFTLFGDRVKHWITFNEPKEICMKGYGDAGKAPILQDNGVADYLCAKHLVLANAKAYKAYNEEFKTSQGGQCGITISVNFFAPLTDSEEDRIAAEMRSQTDWAIYADPIFSQEGGFPKMLEERVAQLSQEAGYLRSRMPIMSQEEKKLIQGSADFFGINHYTSLLVTVSTDPTEFLVPSLPSDSGTTMMVPDEWERAASSWLAFAPNSLYNALKQIHKRYGGPAIMVTENGWSMADVGLEDDTRIRYIRAALENSLDALVEGVNLIGYMVWSLMDNFEWMDGYSERFGLYEVDYTTLQRTRTPRKSAFVYKEIVRSRVVDHSYEPASRIMTIDPGH